MVIVRETYSRLQHIGSTLATIGLLAVGFFIILFGSVQKSPQADSAAGMQHDLSFNAAAHAESPGDSGGSFGGDSCGSGADSGCDGCG